VISRSEELRGKWCEASRSRGEMEGGGWPNRVEALPRWRRAIGPPSGTSRFIVQVPVGERSMRTRSDRWPRGLARCQRCLRRRLGCRPKSSPRSTLARRSFALSQVVKKITVSRISLLSAELHNVRQFVPRGTRPSAPLPTTTPGGWPRWQPFPRAVARRRPSGRSGRIDGSGFARTAESPRTLPAYTEWHRLDLTVRGGAGRASATC